MSNNFELYFFNNHPIPKHGIPTVIKLLDKDHLFGKYGKRNPYFPVINPHRIHKGIHHHKYFNVFNFKEIKTITIVSKYAFKYHRCMLKVLPMAIPEISDISFLKGKTLTGTKKQI